MSCSPSIQTQSQTSVTAEPSCLLVVDMYTRIASEQSAHEHEVHATHDKQTPVDAGERGGASSASDIDTRSDPIDMEEERLDPSLLLTRRCRL